MSEIYPYILRTWSKDFGLDAFSQFFLNTSKSFAEAYDKNT